ncbi:MAG: helix-turn-helix domain-containing protein [Hyphomonadaceae bacterium]|jgi:DNA-binding transcriptional MerR regulator|nr:helix-turn-helix domain-containing protein [Hyphomonadaceae bacterium]
MRQMTIGQLSKAGGVKVTTIRYYESIGLMGEPDRSESGQRLYGDDAVHRLSFIRHARDLGFPMNAVRELMKLQTEPGSDCSAVDVIAREHLNDVRKRLSQLEALESELKRMISSCEGGEVGECRVMAALNDHSDCIAETHERVTAL